MTRREFRSLVPPEEAREAIESLSLEGGTEHVPLSSAHDRVLAERVEASVDVPGFDRAAMDGYAVRARDTFAAGEADPVALSVSGTVHAGSAPGVTVESGTAAEVATGAVMPEGADAVVPVEQTAETDGGVEIATAVTPGEHVMVRGADIASGDHALGPGTRLGPRHIGLLAALGMETVPVRARPQVAIVSTGDELVQPGESLDARAGQIYDVNSHSIASAVRAAGGEPTVYETAADDRDALREVLERATEECSLVLTSGSTSAGSTDLLYRLLEEAGEKLVHGVSVKPGRPLLVGRLFGAAYVGLPGYPVSALMTFTHFVAPELRAVSRGDTQPTPGPAGESAGGGTVDATLRTRIRYDGGRLRLLAVGLVPDGNGSLVAYAPDKGSGATTTLAETDGFVRMDPQRSLLSPGTDVTVERFDASAPLPSLLGVGDPDPVAYALLDALSTPRYLRFGPADAERWFDDGVPDLLVTADAGDAVAGDPDTPGERLARWHREWGLVVPAGNPAGIEGVDALAAEELRFANLGTDISVRGAFDSYLDDEGLRTGDIDGYHRELPGLESATRAVAAGEADAGLGLRETAASRGLAFVQLGTQTVRMAVAPSRREKPAVSRLVDRLDTRLPALLAELPGYHSSSDGSP
jgi:putative molybdopterin biosynthesis protein